MEVNKKNIGNRIKSIRLSLGDNMREFGERIGQKLGLSPKDSPSDSIVSRWEKGVSVPNPERIKAIADLGNQSVDELLYGVNKEEIEKANMFYNDLLEKEDDTDYLIVSPEIKENLLLEAVDNFKNSIFVGEKHLRTTIMWRFKQHYYKTVKSNESLFDLYETSLIDLQNKIKDYSGKEVLVEFDDGLKLFIEITYENISKELSESLFKKVSNLLEETKNLYNNFPNVDKHKEAKIQFIGPYFDKELNRKVINERYQDDNENVLLKKDILEALTKLIKDENLNIDLKDLYESISLDIEDFIEHKYEHYDLKD